MSDALYHSAEHTALVTLVGQDIEFGLRRAENSGGKKEKRDEWK
jgi:hypothetical protein